MYLILLAFASVVLFILHLLVDDLLGTFTRRESAIGTVKSVSAASGRLRGLTVLETETSFYVLRGHANVQKGASLILQTRFNGDEYVCDQNRAVCVPTASRHLAGGEAAKPSASAPTSAAGVAQ